MKENWINSWLERNLQLEDSQKEIVIFGINQASTLLFNLFTMLLISIVIDFLLEGILFLILFIPLRSFAGGYHAKTKKSCFIISNVLYFVFLLLCKIPNLNNHIIYIGSLMLVVAIALLAPVDNSNKRMGIGMSRKMKARTSFVLTMEIIILFGMDFMFVSKLSGILFYVLCLVLILQISGVCLDKIERARSYG